MIVVVVIDCLSHSTLLNYPDRDEAITDEASAHAQQADICCIVCCYDCSLLKSIVLIDITLHLFSFSFIIIIIIST